MKYIAMLRGINVSGQKKIQMADLRCLIQDLGLQDVTTYIQSGNIVFNTRQGKPATLVSKIEQAIEEHYGFHTPVILRTNKSLKTIIEHCPFPLNLEHNANKILVSFCANKPKRPDFDRLAPYLKPPEELILKDSELYLYCPNGHGKSKLSNNFLESKLNVVATTRNIKTVLKLEELSR